RFNEGRRWSCWRCTVLNRCRRVQNEWQAIGSAVRVTVTSTLRSPRNEFGPPTRTLPECACLRVEERTEGAHHGVRLVDERQALVCCRRVQVAASIVRPRSPDLRVKDSCV